MTIRMDARSTSKQQQRWYFIKFTFLVLFQLLDICLNGTSEYQPSHEKLGGEYHQATNDELDKTQLFLCALQIFGQVSSFTVIFSLLCDTFPFQIGMIGLLTRKFAWMISIQMGYIFLTLLICGLRMSILRSDVTMIDLWGYGHYTFFSFFQKLVAPLSTATVLSLGVELGSSKYYTKSAWTNISR